jgi:hypothetical protein
MDGNISLPASRQTNKRRRTPGTQESSRKPGTAPAPEKSFGAPLVASARKYSRGSGNTLDVSGIFVKVYYVERNRRDPLASATL